MSYVYLNCQSTWNGKCSHFVPCMAELTKKWRTNLSQYKYWTLPVSARLMRANVEICSRQQVETYAVSIKQQDTLKITYWLIKTTFGKVNNVIKNDTNIELEIEFLSLNCCSLTNIIYQSFCNKKGEQKLMNTECKFKQHNYALVTRIWNKCNIKLIKCDPKT